jgi:hypothetical protein
MGIYFDRGIEYRVVDKDGNHHILIDSEAAKERLLCSDYFRNNRKTWFDAREEYLRFLPELRMELYLHELIKLKELYDKKKEIDHCGWYEFNRMCVTY